MSTTATAIRTTSPKAAVTVTFEDGTTAKFGGKIADRASHVVIVQRDGHWGLWAKCGRRDLAAKQVDQARACNNWYDADGNLLDPPVPSFSNVAIIPVTEG